MRKTKFWRVGYAPYTTIPGPVYEDRAQCAERARQEKKYGGYRGFGLKPYECDEGGNLIVRDENKEVILPRRR